MIKDRVPPANDCLVGIGEWGARLQCFVYVGNGLLSSVNYSFSTAIIVVL